MIRRFSTRILLVLVGLLAVTLGGIVMAVSTAAYRNALDQARDTLVVGGRVFEELMHVQALELLGSARILTADFGFKEAVSTGERPTVVSALNNHGARIGADISLLVDLRGNVLASTAPDVLPQGRPLPFDDLVNEAMSGGESAGIVVLDGRLYQLVLTPVNAPARIAWGGMAFVMDDRLADHLKSLTNVDVSLWATRERLSEGPVASTRDMAQRLSLASALDEQAADRLSRAEPFVLDRLDQLVLPIALDERADGPMALLQASLSESLQAHHQLRNQVIIIAIVALGMAILAAMFLGGRLARPVHVLAGAARRVARGDYGETVRLEGRDEFGLLAESFNAMQSAIEEREARIFHQLYHDPLTGLPNRARVADVLEELGAAVSRMAGRFTLVLMDLDAFKEVNDTLGYERGDKVLRGVAERLLAGCRGGDLVARLGSDEFLVVLKGVDSAAALPPVRALLESLMRPMTVESAQIVLRPSMGVAASPEHGVRPGDLLRRADIALNQARFRRTRLEIYRDGDDEHYQRRLQIVGALKGLTHRDELTLVYQPKLDLVPGRSVQVEALIRWKHPVLGFVSPGEFIPLAEQSGHISELTSWVVRAVVLQLQQWRESGLALGVSINLSALDLMDGALPAMLAELLRRESLPASALTLEITETFVMQDLDRSLEGLARFRALGVDISIDDFGTGHSSLAQLRRLCAQELKIDRSFVVALEQGQDDGRIVETIIDLAHHLNMRVVAEGVETGVVLEQLRDMDCDVVQGYHIAQPMPPDDLEAWVRRHMRTGSKLLGIDTGRTPVRVHPIKGEK